MGLLARTFESRATTAVNPLHPKDPGLVSLLGLGTATASGVAVSPDRAMSYSAVYQAVRIISETVAQVPLLTYERTGEQGKRRATEHPLFPVLATQPNPEQTSFEWRESMVGHLALRGNAYSEIVMDRGGAVRELWPLHPDRVHPYRTEGGQRRYKVDVSGGGMVDLADQKILRLRTLWGMSVVSLARESIGVGLALDQYAGRFFSNGSSPRGAMMMPPGKNLGEGELAEENRKRLRQSLSDTHGGVENFHRVVILEDGMKWEPIGMTQEDAQFLQSRRFQVTEIARWFNLPAHMLNDLEKATFSNISEQAIAFVRYSMMPWFTRIEQALSSRLLSPLEHRTHFVEFLVDGLLRGDMAARGEFYTKLFQLGALSPNEIRSLENHNPFDGGDEHFVQLNMVPVSQAAEMQATGSDPASPAEGRSAEDQRRILAVVRPLVAAAAARLVRAEDRNVRRALARTLDFEDLEGFRTFLDGFYGATGEARALARRSFEPAFAALAERLAEMVGLGAELDARAIARAAATDIAESYADESRSQLSDAADSHTVLGKLKTWKDLRARELTDRGLREVNLSVSVEAKRLAGRMTGG